MVKTYSFIIKYPHKKLGIGEEHTIRVDEVLRLVKIQRKENAFDLKIVFKNRDELKIPGELADTNRIYNDLKKLIEEL